MFVTFRVSLLLGFANDHEILSLPLEGNHFQVLYQLKGIIPFVSITSWENYTFSTKHKLDIFMKDHSHQV